MKLAAAALFGYLVGSLSYSVILSKLIYGRDLRKEGSGNAGATNMARSYGIGLGIVVVLLDASKAVAALHVGWLLGGSWIMLAGGIACIIGHCFPLYHHFKGGKGVVVAFVCVIAANWKIAIPALVVFSVCAALSRKVSLSSIMAAVVVIVCAFLTPIELSMKILVWSVAVISIIRHKDNIVRLSKGTEKDFKPDSGKRKPKWCKRKM